MTEFNITTGEDFALIISALDENNQPKVLSNFDIVVKIDTEVPGNAIVATTEERPDSLKIIRRDTSTLVVNLPHDITRTLSAGKTVVSVMTIDKSDGFQAIKSYNIGKVSSSKVSHYEYSGSSDPSYIPKSNDSNTEFLLEKAKISVYEVAVEAGFKGTRDEWLKSLSFDFEDITEEQKNELKQPAIEAKVIADAASAAANTAATAANNAATTASQATTTASQAATTASQAATTASQAATTASQAATTASQAATTANAAATEVTKAVTDANKAVTDAATAVTAATQATTAANQAVDSANAMIQGNNERLASIEQLAMRPYHSAVLLRGATYKSSSDRYDMPNSGKTNLTYDQIAAVHILGGTLLNENNWDKLLARTSLSDRPVVTLFPRIKLNTIDTPISAYRAFYKSSIEELDVRSHTYSLTDVTLYLSRATSMFEGCANFKTVNGNLNVALCPDYTNMFKGCVALYYVRLIKVSHNISFADSPALAVDTTLEAINDAANTEPITITLYPTIYNKHSVNPSVIQALVGKQITLVSA